MNLNMLFPEKIRNLRYHLLITQRSGGEEKEDFFTDRNFDQNL